MTSSHLAVSALLLLADVLPGQVASVPSSPGCGGVAGAPCRTAVITEAGYGASPTREYREALNASVGFVKPVTSRLGLGAVATVGLWHGFNLAVGPRFRYYATPTVTVDLTPGLLIRRHDLNLSRLVLDASVMANDQVGMFFQAASLRSYQYDYTDLSIPPATTHKAIFAAGIRLGSKPGWIGMIVDAFALVGAVIVLVVYCFNGCGDFLRH